MYSYGITSKIGQTNIVMLHSTMAIVSAVIKEKTISCDKLHLKLLTTIRFYLNQIMLRWYTRGCSLNCCTMEELSDKFQLWWICTKANVSLRLIVSSCSSSVVYSAPILFQYPTCIIFPCCVKVFVLKTLQCACYLCFIICTICSPSAYVWS